MSYSSRARRQRNPRSNEEKSNEAFFGKQNDLNKSKKNSFFQAKLSVNKPGDKFEKEADAVANAVTNQKDNKPAIQRKEKGSVQRLSTPAEDEKLGTNDARMMKDKELQKKPIQKKDDGKKEDEKEKNAQQLDEQKKEKDKLKNVQKKDEPDQEKEKMKNIEDQKKGKKEEEDTAVQTRHEAGGANASSGLSSKIENSEGKGKSLPAQTLNDMSSSFGYDFSDVKIHNDNESAEMNKELNAQAFTHGEDIYFNEGKFDPEESKGKNLLAHELTHVVQQNKK